MTGFGVFSVAGGEPRVGFRAGDEIRDLSSLGEIFRRPALNGLLAQGRTAWEEALGRALEADLPRVPLAGATLHLPFEVADYVDFFSSLEHATNMGRLFRPGTEPLQPNWRWLPVGYHGRAGTVVVSGTEVVRPRGQRDAAGRGRAGVRARAAGSTSSSSSASSSARRAGSAGRSPPTHSPTTSSASCS